MSAEKFITLKDARAILPGNPSVSTIYLWATRGCRGRVLPSIRCGNRRYLTPEGIASWIETNGGANVPAPRS